MTAVVVYLGYRVCVCERLCTYISQCLHFLQCVYSSAGFVCEKGSMLQSVCSFLECDSSAGWCDQKVNNTVFFKILTIRSFFVFFNAFLGIQVNYIDFTALVTR